MPVPLSAEKAAQARPERLAGAEVQRSARGASASDSKAQGLVMDR